MYSKQTPKETLDYDQSNALKVQFWPTNVVFTEIRI